MPIFLLQNWKLILGGLLAVMLAAGSAWVTHKVDLATIERMERDYAKAETAAVEEAKKLQASEDKVTLDAAVSEATAQVQIVTNTLTITKEIPKYVTETRGCPTFGFIRVLDAQIHGVTPDKLSLPVGQSDDACAPVTFTVVAEWIVGNYGLAQQNAEQLNALEAWVASQMALAPR